MFEMGLFSSFTHVFLLISSSSASSSFDGVTCAQTHTHTHTKKQTHTNSHTHKGKKTHKHTRTDCLLNDIRQKQWFEKRIPKKSAVVCVLKEGRKKERNTTVSDQVLNIK